MRTRSTARLPFAAMIVGFGKAWGPDMRPDCANLDGSLRRRGLRRRWLAGAALGLAVLGLSACGGGGGGGDVASTPPPAPTPTPTPAPTPTPTPTPAPAGTNFRTAEFNRSDGPGLHNAIAAWQNGATGRGVTIGVVDSGIDTDSPEFAGRIDPGSADLAGNRGLEDEDGHGTAVAQVAAAARNNTGILGIAFDANVLVLRADIPGTCATDDPNNPDDGCTYSSTAIAAGLDRAVQFGARVVNLSLGGSSAAPSVRQAVDRATRAGVIVVVSAGNDGDTTDPSLVPDNPDLFASDLRASGNGLVIIAASVDGDGNFSGFSNRAGTEAPYVLAAQGEGVCCEYRNGVLFQDDQGFVFLFNGTSFSAPQVAGAAALLAQAFPNLTGRQIVDLLLSSARDAGTPGTDAVYGRGILDIQRAFSPQGATSLAGTSAALPLDGATATLGPAMGDAGRDAGADAGANTGAGPAGAGLSTVILDGYGRAYAVNLGQAVGRQADRARLAPAIGGRTRTLEAAGGTTSITLSIAPSYDGSGVLHPSRLTSLDAERARLLAGAVVSQVAPHARFAIGIRRGGDGLAARVQGRATDAFLIADAPDRAQGFASDPAAAGVFRYDLAGIGITLAAETGTLYAPDPADLLHRDGVRPRYRQIGVQFDAVHGALDGTLGLTLMQEDSSLLGARFNPALVAGGATSLFADMRLGLALGSGWHAGAAWRQGVTRPDAGARLADRAAILTSSFAVDLSRNGWLAAGDRLALRLAQPLRVSRGELAFDLPVDYDYASASALFARRTLNLAPHGRELTGEMTYQLPLGPGYLGANAFYRRDPGHIAAAGDDVGLALRYGFSF